MQAVQLVDQGYATCGSAMGPEALARARAAVDAIELSVAGTRDLLTTSWCRELVPPLRQRLQEAELLQPNAVAVQCTLFRKTVTCNWKVALHQDLAIPVASPSAHPAMSGWSIKQGQCFVQPPAELLSRMRAVRLHVDPCLATDGPLRVVPGSHRFGRLGEALMRSLRDSRGEVECVAAAGDVLVLQPLLLHASSKASRPGGMRRVLHFLFGPRDPGFGLLWSSAV